ncbi:Zn-ribbon domain-containing OB-fold protein [Alkalihalobacillus sp. MEB130]|uniref:Zn-ribbon domain-containing OB-fold protein n=1 Tax=Alkalihalobacillus sp. MEB130 TaxID=2976704 RepID=UPI0028E062CC|nr:Zn-ribbon domain-containing OB-fold protein [Alkalihalobacillus sp. MEB130]MDT8860256.1 Zn-ribbon domain-containing OB-fold protein [Alkalihalobacillus sp. MEB130]
MTDSLGKYIPNPTLETKPYWEACRNHELLIQQCTDCSHVQFYPRLMCTKCTSKKVEWVRAIGEGTVVSYTIVHRAISKAYQSEAPYVVALIKLEEGPTMMSNIIDCDLKAIEIGMKVKVVFETWSESMTIPQFTPI